MADKIKKYELIESLEHKKDTLVSTFTTPEFKDEMFLFASPDVEKWSDEKKENFLTKTMIEIARDDKLKDCFKSPEGKLSVTEAVQKSCSTGLQIGGKHAYLVPQNVKNSSGGWSKTARYSIRDVGYIALLCGGEEPVLKDIRFGVVRDGDDFRADIGIGKVSHIPKICSEEEEFIGVWTQLFKVSGGDPDLRWWPLKEIRRWRDSSPQFKKSKEKDSTIWGQHEVSMSVQACIRHACEKYEAARELLQSAIYKGEESKPMSNVSAIDAILTEPEINDIIEDEDEGDF